MARPRNVGFVEIMVPPQRATAKSCTNCREVHKGCGGPVAGGDGRCRRCTQQGLPDCVFPARPVKSSQPTKKTATAGPSKAAAPAKRGRSVKASNAGTQRASGTLLDPAPSYTPPGSPVRGSAPLQQSNAVKQRASGSLPDPASSNIQAVLPVHGSAPPQQSNAVTLQASGAPVAFVSSNTQAALPFHGSTPLQQSNTVTHQAPSAPVAFKSTQPQTALSLYSNAPTQTTNTYGSYGPGFGDVLNDHVYWNYVIQFSEEVATPAPGNVFEEYLHAPYVDDSADVAGLPLVRFNETSPAWTNFRDQVADATKKANDTVCQCHGLSGAECPNMSYRRRGTGAEMSGVERYVYRGGWPEKLAFGAGIEDEQGSFFGGLVSD